MNLLNSYNASKGIGPEEILANFCSIVLQECPKRTLPSYPEHANSFSTFRLLIHCFLSAAISAFVLYYRFRILVSA